MSQGIDKDTRGKRYKYLQKERDGSLEYQEDYDTLTKIPLRISFMKRLEEEMESAICRNSKVAVLFLGLDNFKAVNERFGYQFGDCLLRKIAQRLSGNTGSIDSLCRVGGDEFAILLTNYHMEESGANLRRI